MMNFELDKNSNLFNVGKFFGSHTLFFNKILKLPKGNQILEGYINSIKEAAQKQSPYYIMISIDEFKNSDIASIRKQMTEQFNALVYLAENLGYVVENKREGVFVDSFLAGFVLRVKNRKVKDNVLKNNVLEFDKL